MYVYDKVEKSIEIALNFAPFSTKFKFFPTGLILNEVSMDYSSLDKLIILCKQGTTK